MNHTSTAVQTIFISMDTLTLITSVGSIATTGATVYLAHLTAKYVRLTNLLVEEAKAAKTPAVFVDLLFGDNGEVKFMVGNSGSSAAINLTLDVEDFIPWRKHGAFPMGISSLPIVKNGLKYLAPGRTLKFSAGYVDHDGSFFDETSAVVVTIKYETEAGKHIARELTIDLPTYAGVLYESFTSPEEAIAESIRDVQRRKDSKDHIRSMIGRMGRRNCPVCSKSISDAAKKCPHCLEWIETNIQPRSKPSEHPLE